MLREVAGFDHDLAERVKRWPVLEVLHAFQDRLRVRATEQYRNALLVWASLAPWQKKKTPPPQVPDILKDD